MKYRIIIEYGLDDDESQGELYSAAYFVTTDAVCRFIQDLLNKMVPKNRRSYVPS